LLLKQEQQKANEEIYQLMIDQQQKIEEGKSVEKQRISLELHDNVMGNLSGIRAVLWSELFHQGLADKEPFVALLDEIQKIEKDVRNIAHNLNTNIFSGNSSFVEVVNELITKIENHSSIEFTIDANETVKWDGINSTIKINLYRIIQEALHNIEKYATAKNVSIAIVQNENTLAIEIADDGKGFDTNKTNDGIGIKNMKTRMASLNGKIVIESKINSGTKINLTVPI
jgi:signal transduction histidine kinase